MKSLFRTLTLLGVALVAAFGFLIGNVEFSTPDAVSVSFGLGALSPIIKDRGQAFLEFLAQSNNGVIPAQLIEDIGAGRKVIDSYVYYVRTKVSTDGRVQVIDSATNKRKEGYSSLNDGQIEKGSFAVITDLSIKYGFSASGGTTDPANVLYDSLIWDSTSQYAVGSGDTDSGATGNQLAAVAVQRIPTKFVNAEYKLSTGSTIIQDGRIADCLINNKNGVSVNGDFALALRTPKIIREGENIAFDIVYPTGAAAMSADNHFVELALIGIKIRNRA